MIIFLFLFETICCDPSSELSRRDGSDEGLPHLNHLIETVQMRAHNICFYAELTKIIPNYHQILTLSRALEQHCIRKCHKEIS